MLIPYIEQEKKIMIALRKRKLSPLENPYIFWRTIFNHSTDWNNKLVDTEYFNGMLKTLDSQYTREQIIEINIMFEITWMEQGTRFATFKALRMIKQIHINSGEAIKAVKKKAYSY